VAGWWAARVMTRDRSRRATSVGGRARIRRRAAFPSRTKSDANSRGDRISENGKGQQETDQPLNKGGADHVLNNHYSTPFGSERPKATIPATGSREPRTVSLSEPMIRGKTQLAPNPFELCARILAPPLKIGIVVGAILELVAGLSVSGWE
jgi:hypothetical protein